MTKILVQVTRYETLVTGIFNKFISSRGILSKFRNKLRTQSCSHLPSSAVITVAFALMSPPSSHHFVTMYKPYHSTVLAQTSIDNRFIACRVARTLFHVWMLYLRININIQPDSRRQVQFVFNSV